MNITEKKQIYIYREKNSGYQWEEGWGKGTWGRGLRDANYYV